MIYVYQLQKNGNPIYVGVSKNPKRRYKEHVHKISGNFYKQNIEIIIIGEFQTRTEAMKFEGQKKIEYNLEWTELKNASNNGKRKGPINGKVTMHYIYECPRCGEKGKGPYFLGRHIRKGIKKCPL